MNPTSVDIKDMLEAESSLGLTFQTNLFVARQPSSPDNCVTVKDTPAGPVQLSISYVDYYYPTFQVVVRDNDYLTGWSLIEDIVTSLHGRADEVWNSTYYTVIRCISGPAELEYDKNERYILIVNFNAQRRSN